MGGILIPRTDPDFFLPLVLGDGHPNPQPSWSRFPEFTDRTHRVTAVLLLQDRLGVNPSGIYDLPTAEAVRSVLGAGHPEAGQVVGASEWDAITLEWIRREMFDTPIKRRKRVEKGGR